MKHILFLMFYCNILYSQVSTITSKEASVYTRVPLDRVGSYFICDKVVFQHYGEQFVDNQIVTFDGGGERGDTMIDNKIYFWWHISIGAAYHLMSPEVHESAYFHEEDSVLYYYPFGSRCKDTLLNTIISSPQVFIDFRDTVGTIRHIRCLNQICSNDYIELVDKSKDREWGGEIIYTYEVRPKYDANVLMAYSSLRALRISPKYGFVHLVYTYNNIWGEKCNCRRVLREK